MKILHVIPSISPLNGGPSFALHALCRGLALLGAEVDVVTTDDHGPGHLAVTPGRRIPWDGVNYLFFRRNAKFYTTSVSLAAWLWKHASDYEFLHIHSLFSFASIAAGAVAIAKGIPFLVQPHGSLGTWGIHNRRPWLKRLSLRFVEKPILDRARTIYLNTQQEAGEMHEIGIAHKPRVVHYAMDFPAISKPDARAKFHDRYPEMKGKKLALFLSRLHPKKGIDLLIPAFGQVLAQVPDAMLLFAGEGDASYVASLKQQVDELGIADRVRFLGFVSGELKWTALAAADVFVLPSYSENFGIAVVEAMAAGTPVIVSDQAAVCQHVASAGAGVVVTCQVDSIHAALRAILSDSRLAAEYSANAAQEALQFSSRQVAKETLALYQTAPDEAAPVTAQVLN